MTINAGYTKRHDYIGTGIVGPFPYTVPVKDKSQLALYRASVAAEAVPSLLIDGTHYTVNERLKEITLFTALESDETLTILVNPEFAQPINLPTANKFPPEVVEEMADDVTRQAINLEERLDRAVTLVPSSTVTDLLMDTPQAGKFLQVSTAGDKIINSAINASVIEEQLKKLSGLTGLQNVLTVANNIDDVTAVAGLANEIETLSGIKDAIVTTNDLQTKIDEVLGLRGDIIKVLDVLSPPSYNFIWNPFKINSLRSLASDSLSRITKNGLRFYACDGWSVGRDNPNDNEPYGEIYYKNTSPTIGDSLRFGRKSGDTTISTVNLTFNLDPDATSDLRGKSVVLGFKANKSDYTAVDNELKCDILYTTDPNLQIMDHPSGIYSSQHNTLYTLTVNLVNTIEDYSSGADIVVIPEEATQVAVRFRYNPTGTAVVSSVFTHEGPNLHNCYLCVGDGRVNPLPSEDGLIRLNADRQFKYLTAMRFPYIQGELYAPQELKLYYNYSSFPMFRDPEVRLYGFDNELNRIDRGTQIKKFVEQVYANTISFEFQNVDSYGFASTSKFLRYIEFNYVELDARI